jgi:hypothetical protein
MRWTSAILATLVCLGIVVTAGVAKQSPATVAGKWHFVMNTEGGDRIVDATFEQDGNKVTGKFGNDDVKGAFQDGKLNLEFRVNSEEAGPGTLKITGELAKDVITGKWEFQTYGGDYKATRMP